MFDLRAHFIDLYTWVHAKICQVKRAHKWENV